MLAELEADWLAVDEDAGEDSPAPPQPVRISRTAGSAKQQAVFSACKVTPPSTAVGRAGVKCLSGARQPGRPVAALVQVSSNDRARRIIYFIIICLSPQQAAQSIRNGPACHPPATLVPLPAINRRLSYWNCWIIRCRRIQTSVPGAAPWRHETICRAELHFARASTFFHIRDLPVDVRRAAPPRLLGAQPRYRAIAGPTSCVTETGRRRQRSIKRAYLAFVGLRFGIFRALTRKYS